MSNAKREHLVLIGPSRKRAGHTKQGLIACQIRAVELTESRQGGGIVSLLLPKNDREKTRLRNLVNRGYTVETVPIRNHSRKKIRDAVKSPELVVALAELFLLENASNDRAISAFKDEFAEWVCKKLLDHRHNRVRMLIKKAHHELVDSTKPGWWKTHLPRRKK